MMWIGIGVTVLLTFRVVMFRLTLPGLLEAKNDNSLLGDGDEQKECLSVGHGEVNDTLLESPRQGTVGISQLHIYVMPDSKVRW
jgi:hypothetical protein